MNPHVFVQAGGLREALPTHRALQKNTGVTGRTARLKRAVLHGVNLTRNNLKSSQNNNCFERQTNHAKLKALFVCMVKTALVKSVSGTLAEDTDN